MMNPKTAGSNELRTYSRLDKTQKVAIKETNKDVKKVPLTTVKAAQYLIEGTLRLRVCRYCLNVTSELSEFDEVLTLAANGTLHEVTIRDIVASFHPYKVAEDQNFPNKICKQCVDQAISCYLFTQQCEQAERALRNCFNDVYDKYEKLDSLEPVRKRGKRKLHPNHNVIHADHLNVIGYAAPIINIVNVTKIYSNEENDELNELECQKCWQVLPNVESLLNHENSHPKSMWFSCRLCGKSFVKRLQLRKHVKETHKYIDEDPDEVKIDDFKCNECGSTSSNLGQHLQHIEKHKFKSVFKCVVERNIDSLCTVCLDKGSRLMSLKDVVHLHGGYRGLTGEKRIEDILTAAIPEPKHYKYNELTVPHHAKILQMRKRKSTHKELDIAFQGISKKFAFADPVLVQKTNFKVISSITFTFSRPSPYDPDRDSNVLECSITESDMNIINNNSSNAVNVDEKDMNQDINLALKKEIDVKTCKKCWIFNSLNCNDCLQNKVVLTDEQSNKVNDITKGNCQYCWIFGKTGICQYCKKCVDSDNNIYSSDSIEINNSKECKVKNIKHVATNYDKQQKTWKCNICLTINATNRSTCMCCDEEVSKESSNTVYGSMYNFTSEIRNVKNSSITKFGFGTGITNEITNKITTYEMLSGVADTDIDITPPENAKNVKCDVFPVTDTKQGNDILSKIESSINFSLEKTETLKVIKENKEIHLSNIHSKIRIPDVKAKEDLKMDVETIHFIEKYCMNNNYDLLKQNVDDKNIEEMDVVDVVLDDNNFSGNTSFIASIVGPNNTTMETIFNISPSLTFNIGTSGCKNQNSKNKAKKALRRIK